MSSTSFQTCGHDVIAAFDVLHLFAHHRGSVAFSLRFRTKRVNLRDMGRNLKLGLDFENTDGAKEFALPLSRVIDGESSQIANFYLWCRRYSHWPSGLLAGIAENDIVQWAKFSEGVLEIT